VLVCEPPVERRDGHAQLGGGVERPQRVVLVQRRQPEHGHHGVADELLDHAAVPLEHLPDGVEVLRLSAAQGLGVERLSERRRVDDVAEEDGDGAPTRPARRGHVPSVGLCGDFD
jgi:hypothetical protein